MDTTMQVIVSLAGSARGISPAWTNLEAWQNISILFQQYSGAKSDLESVQRRHEPQFKGLVAHRARIAPLIPRMQEVSKHFARILDSDPEAYEEFIAAEDLIENMTEAINIIERRLQPMEKQIAYNQANVDRALSALLQQLRQTNGEEGEEFPDSPADVVDFEITEDIVLIKTLDIVEEELADFDSKQQAEKDLNKPAEEFQIELQVLDRDQEEVDLLLVRANCIERQKELQTRSRNNTEERQLNELRCRLRETDHQLALLGVPIKDGSIVLVSDGSSLQHDSDVRAIQIDGSTRNEGKIRSSKKQIGDPVVMERSLFDGFEDIEKPNASMEESGPPTRDEVADKISRLETRIYSWMGSVHGTADPMEIDRLPSVRTLDDSIDSLADIDASDSITRILIPAGFTRREKAILESRRRAWAVQLSRDCRKIAENIEADSPEIKCPPGYQERLG